MHSRVVRALAFVAVVAGCRGASSGASAATSDAEMLHLAVNHLTDVMVYDIFSPPQASRAYAYASIAAYEAIRSGDAAYRSLAGQIGGTTGALPPVPAPPAGEISAPLAGVHAFMAVGRALTFSRARMDSLRAAMDERFRNRPGMSSATYARSIAYGDTVAKHVLAWGGKDGYLQTRGAPKYTVTNEPGRWVPTPPAYMDAVEPNWNKIRPFVLDSASQFRPEPAYAFDTTRTSKFMVEALEVLNVRRTVTNEQRAITAFWDCNPYVMHVQGHTMFATKKVTPGGHWMGIIMTVARDKKLGVAQSAEAYVRASLALADGFISSWDEKFRSNVIRPETVINKYLDESWEPLLQTPPFPEYTSGHSVISTSAAQVLTDLWGPAVSFTDSTEKAYGLPPRKFTSFEQAAGEAAISRLYGGIHYRHAIEQGQVQGRRVGQYVVARIHTRADRQVASQARGELGTR